MVNIIFLQPAKHSCRCLEYNSGYGRNLDFIPKSATKLLLGLRLEPLGKEKSTQVNFNDTCVFLKTPQFLFRFLTKGAELVKFTYF